MIKIQIRFSLQIFQEFYLCQVSVLIHFVNPYLHLESAISNDNVPHESFTLPFCHLTTFITWSIRRATQTLVTISRVNRKQ